MAQSSKMADDDFDVPSDSDSDDLGPPKDNAPDSTEDSPDPLKFEHLGPKNQLSTLVAYLRASAPEMRQATHEQVQRMLDSYRGNVAALVAELEHKHGGHVMLHVPSSDAQYTAACAEQNSSDKKFDIDFVFSTSKSMGIEFAGGETDADGKPTPIVVIDVKKGSQAENMLVTIGDLVLHVNSRDVSSRSLEDVAPLLSDRSQPHRTLTLRRSQLAQVEFEGTTHDLVELTFHERTLGLVLEGGEPCDDGVMEELRVQNMLDDGAGKRAGVKTGDIVLAVNDRNVMGLSMDEFREKMVAAMDTNDPVKFRVLFGRPAERRMSEPVARDSLIRYTVTFERSDVGHADDTSGCASLGMVLGAGVPDAQSQGNRPTYVRSTDSNSAARRKGLCRGDVVISVAGTDTQLMSLSSIQNLLSENIKKLSARGIKQLEVVFQRDPSGQSVVPQREADRFTIDFGDSAKLGVCFESKDDDEMTDSSQPRLYIDEVTSGSLAMEKGLMRGDFVVAVNGASVRRMDVDDLGPLFQATPQRRLEFEREVRKAPADIEPVLVESEFDPGVELGLSFTGGTPKPDAAGKFRLIRVKDVKKCSRSWADALRPSDVLVSINSDLVLGKSLNAAYQILAKSSRQVRNLVLLRGRKGRPTIKPIQFSTGDIIGIDFEEFDAPVASGGEYQGLRVAGFTDESVAVDKGVRIGDVLVGVNNLSVALLEKSHLMQTMVKTGGKPRLMTFIRMNRSVGDAGGDDSDSDSSISASSVSEDSDDEVDAVASPKRSADRSAGYKPLKECTAIRVVSMSQSEQISVIFNNGPRVRQMDASASSKAKPKLAMSPCVAVQSVSPSTPKVTVGERVIAVEGMYMMGRSVDSVQTTYDGLLSTTPTIRLVLLRPDPSSNGNSGKRAFNAPVVEITKDELRQCIFPAGTKVGLDFGGGTTTPNPTTGDSQYLPLFIKGIESGTAGESMGLQLNDVLLSVNEVNVFGSTKNQAMMQFAKSTGKPRSLVFFRPGGEAKHPQGGNSENSATQKPEKGVDHAPSQRTQQPTNAVNAPVTESDDTLDNPPAAWELALAGSKAEKPVAEQTVKGDAPRVAANQKLQTGPALTPQRPASRADASTPAPAARRENRERELEKLTPIQLRRLGKQYGVKRSLSRVDVIKEIAKLDAEKDDAGSSSPDANEASAAESNLLDEDAQWAIEKKLQELKEQQDAKLKRLNTLADPNAIGRPQATAFDDEYTATHGPTGAEDRERWAYHSGNRTIPELSPSMWREKCVFLESRRKMHTDYVRARRASVSHGQNNLDLLMQVSRKLSEQAQHTSKLKNEKAQQEEQYARRMAELEAEFQRKQKEKEKELQGALQAKIDAMAAELENAKREKEALAQKREAQDSPPEAAENDVGASPPGSDSESDVDEEPTEVPVALDEAPPDSDSDTDVAEWNDNTADKVDGSDGTAGNVVDSDDSESRRRVSDPIARKASRVHLPFPTDKSGLQDDEGTETVDQTPPPPVKASSASGSDVDHNSPPPPQLTDNESLGPPPPAALDTASESERAMSPPAFHDDSSLDASPPGYVSSSAASGGDDRAPPGYASATSQSDFLPKVLDTPEEQDDSSSEFFNESDSLDTHDNAIAPDDEQPDPTEPAPDKTQPEENLSAAQSEHEPANETQAVPGSNQVSNPRNSIDPLSAQINLVVAELEDLSRTSFLRDKVAPSTSSEPTEFDTDQLERRILFEKQESTAVRSSSPVSHATVQSSSPPRSEGQCAAAAVEAFDHDLYFERPYEGREVVSDDSDGASELATFDGLAAISKNSDNFLQSLLQQNQRHALALARASIHRAATLESAERLAVAQTKALAPTPGTTRSNDTIRTESPRSSSRSNGNGSSPTQTSRDVRNHLYQPTHPPPPRSAPVSQRRTLRHSPEHTEILRRSGNVERNFNELLKHDAEAQSALDALCNDMKKIITEMDEPESHQPPSPYQSRHASSNSRSRAPGHRSRTDHRSTPVPSEDEDDHYSAIAELDLTPAWPRKRQSPRAAKSKKKPSTARASVAPLHEVDHQRRGTEPNSTRGTEPNSTRDAAREKAELHSMASDIGGDAWQEIAAGMTDSLRFYNRAPSSEASPPNSSKSFGLEKAEPPRQWKPRDGDYERRGVYNHPRSRSRTPPPRRRKASTQENLSQTVSSILDRLSRDPLLSSPVSMGDEDEPARASPVRQSPDNWQFGQSRDEVQAGILAKGAHPRLTPTHPSSTRVRSLQPRRLSSTSRPARHPQVPFGTAPLQSTLLEMPFGGSPSLAPRDPAETEHSRRQDALQRVRDHFGQSARESDAPTAGTEKNTAEPDSIDHHDSVPLTSAPGRRHVERPGRASKAKSTKPDSGTDALSKFQQLLAKTREASHRLERPTVRNDATEAFRDATEPEPAAGESTAPEGEWTKHFDQNFGTYYWHNQTTGVSTWEDPTQASRHKTESPSPADVAAAEGVDRHAEHSDGSRVAPAQKRASREEMDDTYAWDRENGDVRRRRLAASPCGSTSESAFSDDNSYSKRENSHSQRENPASRRRNLFDDSESEFASPVESPVVSRPVRRSGLASAILASQSKNSIRRTPSSSHQ